MGQSRDVRFWPVAHIGSCIAHVVFLPKASRERILTSVCQPSGKSFSASVGKSAPGYQNCTSRYIYGRGSTPATPPAAHCVETRSAAPTSTANVTAAIQNQNSAVRIWSARSVRNVCANLIPMSTRRSPAIINLCVVGIVFAASLKV
jgi:hypothetical protein